MSLTDDEARLFARFAQASAAVANVESFERLVIDHVDRLLPHGMLLAVIGQRRFDHLHIKQRFGVRYPSWVMAQIPDDIHIQERPIIERWLRSREPQVVDIAADRHLLSAREIFEIETLGLGRLAIHGVADLSVNMASYFSFGQVTPHLSRDHVAALLTLLCPLLHVALCRLRTPASERGGPLAKLTAIEHELLMWMAAGRSNQEMAQLRRRSPSTIRNQVEKLYSKLGVGSRAEAVALALTESQGLP